MTTREEVAEIALSLPGAHQGQHYDTIDFRVKNKIFCTLPAKPGRMGLNIDPSEQAALVAEAPRTFYPGPGKWGAQGWTMAILATADTGQLRELITEAWRRQAPPELVEQLSEDDMMR